MSKKTFVTSALLVISLSSPEYRSTKRILEASVLRMRERVVVYMCILEIYQFKSGSLSATSNVKTSSSVVNLCIRLGNSVGCCFDKELTDSVLIETVVCTIFQSLSSSIISETKL